MTKHKIKKKKKHKNIVYPILAVGVLGVTAHAVAKTTNEFTTKEK